MVKDIKYIIKRILIGVGICLVLSLIRGNLFIMAHAETLNATNACIIGGNNNNVCNVPPVYDTFNTDYGVAGFNVWFQNTNLLQSGGTYFITFSAYINGNNSITDESAMSLYTGNSGSAGNLATPDRNTSFQFYQVSTNQYRLIWSFELDSYHNYDTIRFSWATNNVIIYNGQIIALQNPTLTISSNSPDDSTPGNSDIINNNNQNTQNIIDSNNQNTQDIINNNNSSTDSIINNNNQNTQDIIDNQNQNAEDTQNVIKEQFENCIDEQVVHPEFANVILNIGSGYQGVALNNNNSGGVLDISKYVGETITISFSNLDSSHSSRTNYCFIDTVATSTRKSCISYRISGTTSTSNTFTVTVPDKAKYLYLVGYNNYIDTTWVNNVSISLPKVCSNRLNDINNSLNDDSGVNDSDIDDLFGDIRGNSSSPVSDLLTLPITLLQAYLDGISGTCSPYTLGTLYGTTLVLPCIDIPGIIGTSLWNVVDALFCLYMIYNIAMMCISIYESFTSLDDSMQLLYSPQHSGHTRVSRNEGEY